MSPHHQGALYESKHTDTNDVQTISHQCRVMSYTQWKRWKRDTIESARASGASAAAAMDKVENASVYYIAGTYDPWGFNLVIEPDVKIVKPVSAN